MNLILNFYEKIVNKSFFPSVEDINLERQKLGLIRIFIGFVALVRTIQIIYYYYVLFDFNPSSIILFLIILSSLFFFTIGFFTPFFNLILIFTYRYFENYTGTFTLGTDIFINFLILNILVQSGYHYSIDNLYLKSNQKNLVKNIYSLFTLNNSLQYFKNVYFLFFLYYAFMSLGAILIHVFDPYWYSFKNVKTALVNSYLCKFYLLFRNFENYFPITFGFFASLGTLLQEIFQVFMIPLSFNRWGIQFVKWYGILFFSASLFFLNLSYLPYIELGMWFIIFFPIKNKPLDEKIQIIYDDHCNLCKMVMRRLKFFNFNNSIEFIRLSQSKDFVQNFHLDEKLIKSYMVGYYKGKIYIGYDLYILIFKQNPLFYIFLPFMITFKYIIPIGPNVYKYIAERRYKFFNQCELSPNDYLINKNTIRYENSSLISSTYVLFIIILIYFTILFPYIIVSGIKSSRLLENNTFLTKLIYIIKNQYSDKLAYYMGASVPNVFNKTDLSMSENFFVLHRINQKDTTLVPITGLDGERLNYLNFNILLLSNHNSDILYFNTTLRYRRDILKVPDSLIANYHLNPEQNGFKYIKKLIHIDYNLMNYNGIKKYLLSFYQNKSANGIKLFEYNPNIYTNILRFKVEMEYNGKELKLNHVKYY